MEGWLTPTPHKLCCMWKTHPVYGSLSGYHYQSFKNVWEHYNRTTCMWIYRESMMHILLTMHTTSPTIQSRKTLQLLQSELFTIAVFVLHQVHLVWMIASWLDPRSSMTSVPLSFGSAPLPMDCQWPFYTWDLRNSTGMPQDFSGYVTLVIQKALSKYSTSKLCSLDPPALPSLPPRWLQNTCCWEHEKQHLCW